MLGFALTFGWKQGGEGQYTERISMIEGLNQKKKKLSMESQNRKLPFSSFQLCTCVYDCLWAVSEFCSDALKKHPLIVLILVLCAEFVWMCIYLDIYALSPTQKLTWSSWSLMGSSFINLGSKVIRYIYIWVFVLNLSSIFFSFWVVCLRSDCFIFLFFG